MSEQLRQQWLRFEPSKSQHRALPDWEAVQEYIAQTQVGILPHLRRALTDDQQRMLEIELEYQRNLEEKLMIIRKREAQGVPAGTLFTIERIRHLIPG